MAELPGVLADLAAEGAALDALVADLAPQRWAAPTPAPGWTIGDQIGHLAWTDEIACAAVTEPALFARLVAAAADDPGVVDEAAHERAAQSPGTLLQIWRDGRNRLAAALADLPAGSRIAWFGPPMSATSMATARLMETWAHGLDVAEALGAPICATARLQHVAHLGVRTRDFAYAVRGRTPPNEQFRVELTGPAGEQWTWGPAHAAQSVHGRALDFCLLVTQRRHRTELDLVARGRDAGEWLDIAQAFAGPPGVGRSPLRVAADLDAGAEA